MKNKTQNGKWIFSSLLLAACMVSAQDKGMSSQMPKEKMGGDISMMDMMGKSKQSCMSTSGDLDKVMKLMQDARKSDDKAKMMVAMESAVSQMMTMKENMGQCMGMMGSMMENKGMMDNCMMGEKGKDFSKSKSKAKAKVDTVDHVKHHPAK